MFCFIKSNNRVAGVYPLSDLFRTYIDIEHEHMLIDNRFILPITDPNYLEQLEDPETAARIGEKLLITAAADFGGVISQSVLNQVLDVEFNAEMDMLTVDNTLMGINEVLEPDTEPVTLTCISCGEQFPAGKILTFVDGKSKPIMVGDKPALWCFDCAPSGLKNQNGRDLVPMNLEHDHLAQYLDTLSKT